LLKRLAETDVVEDVLVKLDIRTVILVGGCDFGRCPLAARLPAALWPVIDEPVLLRLLDHLADEGITRATVCCRQEVRAAVEAACTGSRLNVVLAVEELSSGTAGCLREAAASDAGDLLLVLSGSMMVPPPIAGLVEQHCASDGQLTMVFNAGWGPEAAHVPLAEIYLCRPEILNYVPSGGYSDIKEGLVPSVLQAGGTVHPIVLDREVGNFRDRRGYLTALAGFFRNHAWEGGDRPARQGSEEDIVLRGADVFVHPTARICGPVAIADHARIMEGAIVIGPALIGRDAVVGENGAVVRSALWANAEVGAWCRIHESIVDYHTRVPDGTEVIEHASCADVSDASPGAQQTLQEGRSVRVGDERIWPCVDRLRGRLPAWVPLSPRQFAFTLGGVGILLALLWSYWPTFTSLVEVWQKSDEYSSGLLVPFLAAYVVWSRRQDLGSVPVRPALFWGIGLFLLVQAMRAAGLYLMFQSAERLSLILSVAALVLLLMGWTYLRKLATTLLFLSLMLPWPNRVQTAVALPLQRWATTSAVFCLELVGYEIVRDGNVIHIGDDSVAVAEACNGLRMITAFFVISGLVVLLARRTWWEKLVVLFSSLPIALLCNTLRLAITTVFFTVLEGEIWEQRFHDWGGYAMMPLALAMVVGELWLLARLTTSPTEAEPAIISRRQAQRVPDS
jgi:exosortase